jgi:hypothetical protein
VTKTQRINLAALFFICLAFLFLSALSQSVGGWLLFAIYMGAGITVLVHNLWTNMVTESGNDDDLTVSHKNEGGEK